MPSEYTWHVSRVHKRVLKLVNFEVQKEDMSDLETYIVPEHMMPDGQFAILVACGHLFKTVLQLWTHVQWQSSFSVLSTFP